MALETTNQFIDALRSYRLLDETKLTELTNDSERFADARALGQELIERGWLTPYQVNRVLHGGGQELFLGSYVILDKIGEGGMGVVFKARHLTLDRIVALKQIRKESLRNESTVRRFYREVKAAAQLSHPNIVVAYDADEIAGTHVFVMEYVDGIDLAKMSKQLGPLPVAQACDFIRQTALALQHAHERGLVHRDIKPHNLLITTEQASSVAQAGGGKVVKVLDMGVARMTEDDDDTGVRSATMTHDGSIVGSPDYISPEQAQESHSVDIRADLYSLGCTFYQLLTGRVPFPADNIIQKLMKHKYEEPIPVERARKEVPDQVAAIVRKLMAKKPADRYQTPQELAADLEPYCNALGLAPAPKENSADGTLKLLERSKLLMPHEMDAVRERLRADSGTAFDARKLYKWLVGERYVTEYQAVLILRGQVDHFFLGEYKILERIGQGKMAGIYKAMHRLGQVVAIKALPPSKAKDPELLARFQREARLAMRVNHPNVVRAFHVGKYGPLHYIVMEHIEGETLEDYVQRKGKLSPAEAVPLVYQALLGVQHLQEMSIVHRDLNPDNLMVVPNEAPGRPPLVKVLDIGMGRGYFTDDAAQAELTKAGALLGSPYYMAPEQAVDAHTADVRSDIYSLGCVLYFALAGRSPFTDKNVVQQIVRHATELAIPLNQLNAEVTDELQEIVSCMMAKDPAQRYATAAAAANALRSFLHNEGGPVRTPKAAAPMQSYLTWLDMTPVPEEAAPSATVVTQFVPDLDVMHKPEEEPAPAATEARATTLVDAPIEIPYALPMTLAPGETVSAPVATIVTAPVAQLVTGEPLSRKARVVLILRTTMSATARLARASGRLPLRGIAWARQRLTPGKPKAPQGATPTGHSDSQ